MASTQSTTSLETNFQALGLNNQMQSVSSPLLRQRKVPGYEFGAKYEVYTDKVHTSKLVVEQLIKRTGVTYGTGNFASGTSVNITTTTHFDPPNKFKPFFGIPYISIFEGTPKTTAYEIYPIRGTSVAGTYAVTSGFDQLSWAGTPSLVYRTQITRNAGTSVQTFVYAVDVEYIDYVVNSGTTV